MYCHLFSYVLKIKPGLSDINKQVAIVGNVLLQMFSYLSLALNMQGVSRGRESSENSPFDIHLARKGKIHCVHIQWIFKIKQIKNEICL